MDKQKLSHLSIGLYLLAAGLLVVVCAFLMTGPTNQEANAEAGTLKVVAAENFWGDLVSQVGGQRVAVDSIVSDPNADPHDFAIQTSSAKQFAAANYIVLNGAGYDSWGDKLLANKPAFADGRPTGQLIVAKLIGKTAGDNPHFWYSPQYVNRVSLQIKRDLIQLDPQGSAYYSQRYQNLQKSLAQYQAKIDKIKHNYAGTQVAATEDAFNYLIDACGLKLVSPESFMQAVSEGGQPPTRSVIDFQRSLQHRQAKVLLYNGQTQTPLTQNMRKKAVANGIPVVSMTEITHPAGAQYQAWMSAQIDQLIAALQSSKGQAKS